VGLKVDLGHAFPRGLGGKYVTLECVCCNSRMNRLGDNELIRLFRQWEAMRRDRHAKPIHGYLDMPSGRVGADISSVGFHAHWKNAHPEALKEAVGAMRDGSSFQLVIPQINWRKVDIAYLHSAHLLFFREFGYAYLAAPVGRYVRQLLASAESNDDPGFLCVEMPRSSQVDPSIIFRIGVSTMPDGQECLFAALPVPNPDVVCQFIFLPAPYDEGAAQFKELLLLRHTWVHQIRCRTIDRRICQHLIAPEYHNALWLAWKGWPSHNVDMTKLMWAIRREAEDQTGRNVDAKLISKRLGIHRSLDGYVHSLSERGFLSRHPKRQRFGVNLSQHHARPSAVCGRGR
jgi:hypothetical protein